MMGLEEHLLYARSANGFGLSVLAYQGSRLPLSVPVPAAKDEEYWPVISIEIDDWRNQWNRAAADERTTLHDPSFYISYLRARLHAEGHRASAKRLALHSIVERTDTRALEARVRRVERAVEDLRAKQQKDWDDDDGDVTRDPHFEWIEANRELLRTSYPNSFVAVDYEKGVLLHSSDADDFGEKLARLSNELSRDQHERVMAFHTSMFV